MRILCLHADSFSFSVTGKTSVARHSQPLTEEEKTGRYKECLVVFTAIEKEDEKELGGVVGQAISEIQELVKVLGVKKIIVYPYAHLSSQLASPSYAVRGLSLFKTQLDQLLTMCRVFAAPFGHYKSFQIACKGHPLSELGKTITTTVRNEEKSEALKAEKVLKSTWKILTPDGDFKKLDKYSFKGKEALEAFVQYEQKGTREVAEAPPHIKLMRELELVDYEPGSDPGNFRWYPKGQLIKRLLEGHVSRLVQRYGGMRVETPIMYDYDHPHLARYLERFPARQYILKSEEKEFFLRFAACFGQYLINHDAKISYKNLPFKLYELTHYSFRREQTGELAGLRRLRTFTMPDMHTLVRDFDEGKKEFLKQVDLCLQWCRDLELPVEVAVRFIKDFYEEHEDFCKEIIRKVGQDALVELWDQRFFYFVVKFELNFVDTQKKAACLSTVQLDVENAERFDIFYVDEKGEKVRPLIMHASISGSIDRNVYAFLEHQAARIGRGEKGSFPFWLAPTQIRMIPVSERFNNAALELVQKIPFRTDLDDRDLSVSKKIRAAELEWVPFILVYGEREMEKGTLTIRPRTGEQFSISVEQFMEKLREQQKDLPFEPLNLPVRLSERAIFVG